MLFRSAALLRGCANDMTDRRGGGRTDGVSDEAAPVGADGEVDVEEHDKLGSREEAGDVPPEIELSFTFGSWITRLRQGFAVAIIATAES